jgi:hypothetical protein
MYKTIKPISISILISIFLTAVMWGSGWGEEVLKEKAGTLKVFSKHNDFKFYLDNELIGEAPLTLENVQAGTHLLKAAVDDAAIYEEIITIKEDEVTTLFIPPEEKEEVVIVEKQKIAVKPDYSKEVRSGPFLSIGYFSSNFNSSSTYTSLVGSSIGYGVGYQFGIGPHVDLRLSVKRSEFSDEGTNWYLMPIRMTFSFATRPNIFREGKQYYAFSLGYCMTNIKEQGKDISGLVYGLAYGNEFPISKKDSIFLETGFIFSNPENASLSNWYFSAGYKWNFK